MKIVSNPPTIDEYKEYKSRELMFLKCHHCNVVFGKLKHKLMDDASSRKGNHCYCSRLCAKMITRKRINIICKECGILVEKKQWDVNKIKSGNCFCSQSCAGTYHNKHKKHGSNRSKLELYIENKLNIIYPNLNISYNNVDAINAELDIYIPELNLAFELNGIFHYEPIFGKVKFNRVQCNDARKFQACLENEIEFCIIDTSMQRYFKESTSQKYLDIITKLVNKKLEAREQGVQTVLKTVPGE